VRSRSRGRDLPALLDALVVTIGLGVVSWQFLMVPYARNPSLTLDQKLTSILLPLADVVLLAVLVRLLGGGWRPAASCRPPRTSAPGSPTICTTGPCNSSRSSTTTSTGPQAESATCRAGVADERLTGELQGADEVLEGVEKGLGEETRVLHHLMGALPPPVLDNRGFAEALSEHAQRFEQENGTAVDIEIGLEHRLSPELETILYRITQKLLNNIAKHARAGQVSISVDQLEEGTVRPRVRDDGVGFDTSNGAQLLRRAHFGLAGMRERPAWSAAPSTSRLSPGTAPRSRRASLDSSPTRPSMTRRWSPAPAARRSAASAPATCGMPSGSCGAPPGPGCSPWTVGTR
jgi:hypothetical protein